MINGGKGGANTKTGLNFEKEVSLESIIESIPYYSTKDNYLEIKLKTKNKKILVGKIILFKGKEVAKIFKKHKLYSGFLEPNGVNYNGIISKKLLPDETIYIEDKKIIYIIEQKYQKIKGSVDEKLQTCDFKKKQYAKLFSPLGIKTEYVYVLGEWFKDPTYKDTLGYINNVNCHYFFSSIPLDFFGLPKS